MLFKFAIKVANRADKINKKQEDSLIALALLDLFNKKQVNNNAKKVINEQLRKEQDNEKNHIIRDYVKSSDAIFYLASSHNDCAEDHKPYQGKIYVDEKYKKDYPQFKTIQWVMGSPVYFVTRPYCRHYFVKITEEDAKKSLKFLKNKYKTHSEVGDRSFSTPIRQAIEQYEDRLAMLKALYAKFKTEKLKNMILKTEMLLKKWKNVT